MGWGGDPSASRCGFTRWCFISYIIVCSTCIPLLILNSWHLWPKTCPDVHIGHSVDWGDDITGISDWIRTIQVISLLLPPREKSQCVKVGG